MNDSLVITSINTSCPNVIVATPTDCYIYNFNQETPLIVYIKERCDHDFPYKLWSGSQDNVRDLPITEYLSNSPQETEHMIIFIEHHPEIYMTI